jgi:hypothetical protein
MAVLMLTASRAILLGLALVLAAAAATAQVTAERTAGSSESAAAALLRAYPSQLARIEGAGADAVLVWHDGTRMPFGGSGTDTSLAEWLANPDPAAITRFPYPAGDEGVPPAANADPGRARPVAFFQKLYGDCNKGETARHLVDVVWLPKKLGQRLKVSQVNGVAARLQAISDSLDALPASFDLYLKPSAGSYICRAIAGTSSPSAHGYGIAIDIAVKPAHYWRWSRGGPAVYQNSIPMEIVRIFEAHGFIWGGKWYHYDTMHFEYRPELLPPTAARP